ncbi:MAG: hypothetical protein Q9200_005695, partial [Gallowayella weberi]
MSTPEVMEESTAGSETANSDAVNASSTAAPPSTNSGSHVLATTHKRRPVQVMLPYPDSTAPRSKSSVPRSWQRLPEQNRFKRQTDVRNPYVQYQTPTPVRSTSMAGGQRSSSSAKKQSDGGKNGHKEPTEQPSLIDTEIGVESLLAVGGGVVGSGGGQRNGEKEVAKDGPGIKMENTGTLLELGGEDTAPDVDKGKGREGEKSAFEQLLELEGFEMDNITTTTTTTTTITTVAKTTTIAETKAPSPIASSKGSTTSSKSQLRTDGSLFMRELSVWGARSGDSEQATPSTASDPNAEPPMASAETSNEDNDHFNIDVGTLSGPSSSSQQVSSTEPDPATTTLAAQEFAKETGAPFTTLGTELDLWAAELASSRYSLETETEKKDDRGYIRRFQSRPKEKEKGKGKGKESEAMPDERNAMVKYDPFQSLWLNAVERFDVEGEGKNIGAK